MHAQTHKRIPAYTQLTENGGREVQLADIDKNARHDAESEEHQSERVSLCLRSTKPHYHGARAAKGAYKRINA
jgi:hypothetical protein